MLNRCNQLFNYNVDIYTKEEIDALHNIAVSIIRTEENKIYKEKFLEIKDKAKIFEYDETDYIRTYEEFLNFKNK